MPSQLTATSPAQQEMRVKDQLASKEAVQLNYHDDLD
jgi:hypothetical protein